MSPRPNLSNIPSQPRIRPVEPVWVDHQGQPFLHLRDPLQMADQAIMIPQHLAPLVALMDGTREVDSLPAALSLRTGVSLTTAQVREFVAAMDSALLLENGAFKQAAAKRLKVYRDAPFRKPSHADLVYPSKADELTQTLARFAEGLPVNGDGGRTNGRLAGVLSPHIDYERGGKTYAELWQRSRPYLDDVELAVIFGTDHSGGLGTLTPTVQSYASPYGVMPTDREVVDGLAEALGEEDAYAEEMHHVNEHSIELALVWFHHFAGGRDVPVVPVLCGSFAHFIDGEGRPAADDKLGRATEYLKEVMAGRNTLVIAAGDLSHVGPVFGDARPIDDQGRKSLENEDNESINAICEGDPEAFFEMSRAEMDARRICGLSPIYMMLRLLEGAGGASFGYDQCAADQANASYVSIAGAMLFEG